MQVGTSAVLHPDFKVRGGVLHDIGLHTQYRLSTDAIRVLADLGKGKHLHEMTQHISREQNLRYAEVMQAITAFYGQLARIGGLRVTWGSEYHWLLRLKARLVWRSRNRLSLAGFIKGVWRAYGLFVVGFLVLYALGSLAAGFPLWLLSASMAAVASCIVHEIGHIVAIKLYRQRAVLLSHAGYLACMYLPQSVVHERNIAAAGPLSGIIFCTIVMIASHGISHLIPLCIAIPHAMCLLPVCADGRSIWAQRIQENPS